MPLRGREKSKMRRLGIKNVYKLILNTRILTLKWLQCMRKLSQKKRSILFNKDFRKTREILKDFMP
jgi:hypothetical protein